MKFRRKKYAFPFRGRKKSEEKNNELQLMPSLLRKRFARSGALLVYFGEQKSTISFFPFLLTAALKWKNPSVNPLKAARTAKLTPKPTKKNYKKNEAKSLAQPPKVFWAAPLQSGKKEGKKAQGQPLQHREDEGEGVRIVQFSLLGGSSAGFYWRSAFSMTTAVASPPPIHTVAHPRFRLCRFRRCRRVTRIRTPLQPMG